MHPQSQIVFFNRGLGIVLDPPSPGLPRLKSGNDHGVSNASVLRIWAHCQVPRPVCGTVVCGRQALQGGGRAHLQLRAACTPEHTGASRHGAVRAV